MAPTEPPVSTRVGDSSWSSRHPLAAQVVHVGLGVPALALGVALASLTVLQSRFHDEAVAAYGLSVHVPSLDAVIHLPSR